MLSRTKIVATIGPATDDPAVLTEMVHEGLDVARLNASHGTRDDHDPPPEDAAGDRAKTDQSIGTLMDLGGPKIRIESFVGGKVMLEEGKPFTLDTDAREEGRHRSTPSASPTRTCRATWPPATRCC